jgi:hypothetical protein
VLEQLELDALTKAMNALGVTLSAEAPELGRTALLQGMRAIVAAVVSSDYLPRKYRF